MKLINSIIFVLILYFILKKNKENFDSHPNKKNIYGEQLAKCKLLNDESDRDGSFEEGGYCTQLGGGVHQLCFNLKEESKNFAADTKQKYNWSEDRLCKEWNYNGKCVEELESNNHCMCLGAYSLFKNRQIENSRYKGTTSKTSNELVCDAIPETVFNKEYISKWDTWNGDEITNQAKIGIEEMVKQCSKNIPPNKKLHLMNKYCNLANRKNYMKKSKFYKKKCIKRMSNNFNLNLLKSDGDDIIQELITELQNNSFKNWLKSTQKWCANMRSSKSIITAVLPLKNQDNGQELFFPISVCCSSDYCLMLQNTDFPKFYYRLENGIYYLVKDFGQNEQKIVQIIEPFESEDKGKERVNLNQDIYFPFISKERILNEICLQ